MTPDLHRLGMEPAVGCALAGGTVRRLGPLAHRSLWLGEAVPLSETVSSGSPRRSIRRSSSLMTRRPEIDTSGIAARHSLVTSSLRSEYRTSCGRLIRSGTRSRSWSTTALNETSARSNGTGHGGPHLVDTLRITCPEAWSETLGGGGAVRPPLVPGDLLLAHLGARLGPHAEASHQVGFRQPDVETRNFGVVADGMLDIARSLRAVETGLLSIESNPVPIEQEVDQISHLTV